MFIRIPDTVVKKKKSQDFLFLKFYFLESLIEHLVLLAKWTFGLRSDGVRNVNFSTVFVKSLRIVNDKGFFYSRCQLLLLNNFKGKKNIAVK